MRKQTDSQARSSNIVFTIWAVFGGFILHFLLSNYLSVLLRPSFEEPVENAADMIKRNITLILWPTALSYSQFFRDSTDPNIQEVYRRLIIAKNWDVYEDLRWEGMSTGVYADVGPLPGWPHEEEDFKNFYKSTNPIAGDNPYIFHIANKKWPLKKVRWSFIKKNNSQHFTFRNMILIFFDSFR